MSKSTQLIQNEKAHSKMKLSRLVWVLGNINESSFSVFGVKCIKIFISLIDHEEK